MLLTSLVLQDVVYERNYTLQKGKGDHTGRVLKNWKRYRRHKA